MTLAALVVDHPFADEEALVHTVDRSVTKAGVVGAAQELAGRLGDVRGRAVAVQLPNGPDVVSAMVGVWLAGGVYVPLNARDPDVGPALDATGPAAVVTAGCVEGRDGATAYDADGAFVMWTSGTTGRPKPVLHTHTGYLEVIDRVLGPLRGGDRGGAEPRRPAPNLIPVSMALNAGLFNTLFALRAGAALVIMDRFEPGEFAELVRRFGIRSTVLPPAALTMLVDAAEAGDDLGDLAPLRYVRSITAPLSPLQARRFADRFPVVVLNSYGQAELGEVIGWTAADAREHPDKLGAAGRPHPGVDIRIDGDGHLRVRAPSTATGLEGRLDADGFVDTGDLARVDDDGFVWIEGRAGDLVNRGGNKVFPEAVEEVLRLSPAVDDAAVVGEPDERLGEVPVAYLVGRPVGDAELVELCRTHLAAYKVPVAFRWVDALPRNEVGKLLRAQLRTGAAPPR